MTTVSLNAEGMLGYQANLNLACKD